MASALTGMMARVTDLFKGGKDDLVRDKLREAWKGMPEYPRSQPVPERIKWLLKRFYYEAQYEKLQLHRKWFRNHLFFGGYHDSVLSDIGFTFDSLGVNSAEYGFASNYYRSYIRYGTAMYVQTAPEFVAQPTSPDPESQGVASAARSALDMIKENIGYDAIRAIEAQNLRLYGNSFRYSYYSVDPRYGFQDAPVYEDVEMAIAEGQFYCPQCGMQGQGNPDVCPQCGPGAQMPPVNIPQQMGQVPVLKGKTSYPKGQEMCEVVWPFEGYMRSSCKSLSVAPFFLRVRMADTVALHATFPKADFGANSSPVEGMTASEDIGLIYQQAAADLPNDPTQYPGWYERATAQSKSLLIQGWVRPNMYYFDKELSEKFKEGLYGALTDDCLLETRNESMDDHWTHFKHIHVEGRVWGDGDDDLIPIQMQNDECDRMLMRHVDWNTMPVMMGDSQKVDKNNIWNDAGYMVEVKNLGQRSLDQVLKWFPGGQISPDVWAWKNTRLQDMQFHSGVSAAAIGQHEPGINTFGGQENAVSRSQAMLGPLQLMYKEQNELWAAQMLKIVSKNWLDERVQAAMGVNGQWEFKQLRGEMLKMDRVRIVARIIPEDFNKQQSLVQAISAGAFNPELPPSVRRKVLELYQMPTDLDSYSGDEKVQQKEIDGAKQNGGQFPPPTIWQNDDAHMDSLSHYGNSDEYDSQPPEFKAGHQKHFLDHLQNKATKMAIAGAIQGAHTEAGGQPQQGGEPQASPGQRQADGQKRGAAAKPNRPQPPGGNQHATGRRGMSDSAQQRRRNGKTR